MPTDAERLDWLASSLGHSLMTDGFGRWVVTGDATQNMPNNTEVPSDIHMMLSVSADRWHDDIRSAIDEAIHLHPNWEQPFQDR